MPNFRHKDRHKIEFLLKGRDIRKVHFEFPKRKNKITTVTQNFRKFS